MSNQRKEVATEESTTESSSTVEVELPDKIDFDPEKSNRLNLFLVLWQIGLTLKFSKLSKLLNWILKSKGLMLPYSMQLNLWIRIKSYGCKRTREKSNWVVSRYGKTRFRRFRFASSRSL